MGFSSLPAVSAVMVIHQVGSKVLSARELLRLLPERNLLEP